MDVPSARARRLPAAAFARARSLVRVFVRALVRVLITGSFLAACLLGGVASAQAQRLPEVGALPDDHVADRHWPNDPLFAQQWPLHNTGQGGDVVDADVDAPEAWRVTRGSPQIVIAVLDDGFDLDHPDLAERFVHPGYDYTSLPARPGAEARSSADRHGTSVAGIVAARGNNALGITGICPECRILPIRVRGAPTAATAAAFRYAVEQGADVISNSWGYARDPSLAADDALRQAIDAAAREGRGGRGTLVVFGMPNEPVDNCSGPAADIAALDSVVAVGVSNHNDRIGFSGYGECMRLVAPAKPKAKSTIGVPTTDRTGLDGHADGDYHVTFGGTSAAAPLVAGIAGLLLSLNPELTRTEIERILEHTADKIDPAAAGYDERGFSPRAGYGRVNAARALVPHAKVSIEPDCVAVGQPFSVRVTASAPWGLDAVSWAVRPADGEPASRETAPDAHSVLGRRRTLRGEAYAESIWTDAVIERPGLFEVVPDARDVRFERPVEGYPHSASRSGEAMTATVLVTEPGRPACTERLR